MLFHCADTNAQLFCHFCLPSPFEVTLVKDAPGLGRERVHEPVDLVDIVFRLLQHRTVIIILIAIDGFEEYLIALLG